MPRPLSVTETDPSGFSAMSIRSQCPASASSIALSDTSNPMWWRPEPSSVSPIYMPGRLRTASRPLSTLMLSAPYSFMLGADMALLLRHELAVFDQESFGPAMPGLEQGKIGAGHPGLSRKSVYLFEQR